MSSNLRIPKTCEFCGNYFIAMTFKTRFCSDLCGKRNYKKVQRDAKMAKAYTEFKESKEKPVPVSSKVVERNPSARPYLSVKEACKLLSVSDTTLRKAIKEGMIKTVRIGKKHIIRREDIEKLFVGG